jgi:osmotically-inducible protein OsmY
MSTITMQPAITNYPVHDMNAEPSRQAPRVEPGIDLLVPESAGSTLRAGGNTSMRESARHDRLMTGERRSDDHLLSTIACTLEWNRLTPLNAISVRARGGDVTLAGYVYSSDDRQEAGALVQRIPGVRNVDNRIEVLTEDAVSARLKSTIVDLLRRRTGSSGEGIGVRMRNGRVVLTGEVGSSAEKRMVIDMLQWNHHVHAIEDRLEIRRGQL